jgi:hypothetical protein
VLIPQGDALGVLHESHVPMPQSVRFAICALKGHHRTAQGIALVVLHKATHWGRTLRVNLRTDKNGIPGEFVKRGVTRCWLHGWLMR